MTKWTLTRRSLIGAGAAFALRSGSAYAQAWPNRTIQMLVGFGAGGVTDVAIRLLAEALRPSLSQPIVIENKPGASGMIAAATVARASPDGHVLLGMPGTITIVPSVMRQVPIDVLADLTPICIFATSPNVIIVKADAPQRTLKELVSEIKTKPAEDYLYASSGVGTTVHLMAGMLERAASIRMRHVPFRSSAESIQSVLSGQLPIVFSSLNSALPFIQAGSVRALAVATKARSDFLPNVPTFEEEGISGMQSDTWFGLGAPAGMNKDLVAQIADLTIKAMEDPAIKERLAALGAQSLSLGPAEAMAQMRREVKYFSELAAEMGIKRDQ